MASTPQATLSQSFEGRPVDAWLTQADAHEQAGRLDEAERIIAPILDAIPDSAPLLHQAGVLSYRRHQPHEAIARLERAIALAPEVALYHRNIAEFYRTQSRLDDALRHGQRAVDLAPDEPNGHYNLGIVHYDRMETEAAIQCMRRVLKLDDGMATAHFELAEALLLSGRFKEGWREYEWRFAMPGAPRLLPSDDRPLWDGEPMPDGTLLLIGDQGFGDTIQFSRYIAEVAKRCPNLIVACSVEMRPVVSQQAGVVQCFDRWDDVPAFDACCPLSGLPRLFRTRLDTIPAPVPHVRADARKAARWRERLDRLVPAGYRRIGLVWAGRPTHGNDLNRSMRLPRLHALAALEGVALISLQMGPAEAEAGRYFGDAPLFNLGPEIEDFTDTMAILDGIERLVSVDTAVAHLAGAMGVPVSLLLPYAPDWRWLTTRTDTPWYPTVTLCRQDAPGQWQGAIGAMLHTLRV
jgi:Tetratricopeptide repeat